MAPERPLGRDPAPRQDRRRLTHVDRSGRPRMVDVSDKTATALTRPSAGFLEQAQVGDHRVPVDALDHIVDRECGHGGGGESLHLDACLRDRGRLSADAQAAR
jgi:hypothetical protein